MPSATQLAEATGNSGNVISVEPDTKVHADLRRNRDAHSCNVHILRGTVSTRRLAQGHGAGYEHRTRVAGPREQNEALDNFAVHEIERLVGLSIHAVLTDSHPSTLSEPYSGNASCHFTS